MKLAWSLFSILVLAGPLVAQDEKDYTEAFQLIEVWLDAQKDYEKLPGITALVLEDQEVMWSGGLGLANVEDVRKAEPSTRFSICSISKLFTAVAIMKLYDEGKLRLDDTVDELLPWYNLEQQYLYSGPITVRSLLTHSSGLPRESNHPYWTGPDFPFPERAAVRDGLAEQETLYPASSYFQYSNLGLTLLGEIVAEVSGRPYEQYIQENVLGPLGLDHTRTAMPEALYGNELAIGYSALDRDGKREQVQLFDAKGITAAAGYSSTVEDLGKFAAWQFRLLDKKEPEILLPATLDYMQRVHWTDPDWTTSWGLGFAVSKGPDNTRLVGHGGSCPGYRSSLTLDLKNKRAYVVMINAGNTNPGKYINGITEILKKVKGKKGNEENGSPSKTLKLEDYAGYYNPQPWGSEEYIAAWEGGLAMLELPADEPAKAMALFKHVEGDTFQRIREGRDMSETITFERNAEGKVYRYRIHGNYSYKKEAKDGGSSSGK